MLFLVLGIIIGLLLNPAKEKIVEKIETRTIFREKAQFVESVSGKEKFEKAEEINDLLES